jgi:hypothetical protein
MSESFRGQNGGRDLIGYGDGGREEAEPIGELALAGAVLRLTSVPPPTTEIGRLKSLASSMAAVFAALSRR